MTTSPSPAARTGPRAAGADYVLNPATRMLWRPDASLQLELGDRSALLTGVSAGVVSRLVRSTQPGQRRSRSTTTTLRALCEAGFLWRATGDPAAQRRGDVDERLVPPRPRLAGQLAALQARSGERAAELLSARRHAVVAVYGTGRAGPHLAALLAAAGVGRVHVSTPGTVRLGAAVPGGVLPADEGRALSRAATEAVTRAAPEADTEPPGPETPVDLAILADDEPVDPDRREALHRQGRAHLTVAVGATRGVVGPLVLPGLTSCLRCADLHRADRDPAWDSLAVQLTIPRRGPVGTDCALATVVAGTAALQALSFLDGEEPATIEGTLELHLPDWRLRRRSWPLHPDCGCGTARPGAA
ncbi:MAG: hypothetical protein EPN43_12825 [Jatrophihabitans sp.]|nr:MAG: hypothetical protein EPN43_12825 [Jatrophihabitans sp.]